MSISADKNSRIKKTPFTNGGKKGIIVHDKLCADGPVDENGNPLLDEDGNEIPGLNDDLHDALGEYVDSLVQPINLSVGSDMMTAPRYGVLSLLAQNTPIHLYDHPALKKITNTAFTDGIHIFIDADFMRELVKEEEESSIRQSGVIFLILHELMHKLYLHVDRLKQFPHDIANKAEDMVINGKIIKSFPTVQPVNLLTKIGFGMKASEAEKYYNMAEEVVAEMLLREKRKEEQKNGKGKQGQSGGGGGGGQSQSGGGQNQSGGGQGNQDEGDQGEDQEQDQQNDNGSEENGGYSPIHHITPEELIEILEENGLSGTLEALDLPESAEEVEAIAQKKDHNRLNITDAVQNAIQQSMMAGGKYPGQHIAEEAMSIIGSLQKGKISWKLAIRREVGGEGQKMRDSDDEAHIVWHLEKDMLGVEPWYMPAPIPHAPDETVLCLVDSSGSTGGGTMRQEFMSEVLNLKNGLAANSDYARKVILFSADTVLRGEPIEITSSNVEHYLKNGVPMFGDGGTDFLSCLTQAVEAPIMKKEKIKTVIYFTDCYDATPTRKDFEKYLNQGMKFIFVTTPGTWNEKWNAEVADWAEVYCIEEGTVADLDKDRIEANTRKNNVR